MKKHLLILIILSSFIKVDAQFVANAGNPQTIIFPTTSTTVSASASGDAATPYNYVWTKVSGNKYANPTHPLSQTTTITGLRIGVYVFRVIATDNSKHHYKSKAGFITITVDSSSTTLQANAGSDVTIGRFNGYSVLDGTSSTGTITASNWQLISATVNEDGVAYIDERTQLKTSTHLMPYGNYSYQLSVTNSTLTKTLSLDQINQPCSFLVLNNVTSLTTGMYVFGQFIQGNTTITSIGHDTIFISHPIVYPVYAGNTVTFATGTGDLSKDTVNVTSNYQVALPPQRNSWHRVTSGTLTADRITCPFCNINDYIIDGANDGNTIGGLKTDIYIPPGTFTGQLPGTTIFVNGGIYQNVNFDCAVGDLVGTVSNPITITNYGTQLQGEFIRFNNIQYAHITGRYVNGVSGNSNYLGFDGSYTFPEGTFGIYANNGWESLQAPSFAITGSSTNIEVDFVEGGNGGFCGFWCKENPQGGSPDYNGMHIHDTYFHDTGGEIWYFMLTNGDSPSPAPNQLNNSEFNNNIGARSGNEVFQVGQLGSNNYFHNNTGSMSAVRWRSPFQESQYFGGQFGIRNGKNHIDSCIFLGSGEQTLSAICYAKAGLAYDGGTLTFTANTFQYSKGFIANYLQGVDGANIIGMPILFDSCVFGNSYFSEDSVFRPFYPPAYTTPQPNFTNTSQVLRSATDSNTVTMRKSYRDNTKTTLIANACCIDTSGTTAVSQLPTFDWNSGFDTSNYRTYSMWGNWILSSMGDEFTNQTDFRQGQQNIFQTGQMVCWLSKFYVSKINNNWNHMPVGVTDAYWTLKTYTNGSNTVTTPPDDYRLSSTNFYYLRGMGITQHQ